jgi:hypothetical protein
LTHLKKPANGAHVNKLLDSLHKYFFGALMISLMMPFAGLQWLLLDGQFTGIKAALFVALMFLFGSVFIFN